MTVTDPRALDPIWLRAQRSPRHDTTTLVRRIRDHLDQHDGYVSLSGGKDSLVVLHLALQADPAVPVCFFDSGLEYPETIAYLDALETFFNITITTYKATPSLLDILTTSGAWDHHQPTRTMPTLDRILIHDPAARAATDHGPGVLWGLRADESRQRTALFARNLPTTCTCCTTDAQRRTTHGGHTTSTTGPRYSPIWNWTSHDIWAHITRHHLPLNPVYTKLRNLGAPEQAMRVSHVIDGSHLDRGRLVWLRAGWPELWGPLVQLLPRLTEFT